MGDGFDEEMEFDEPDNNAASTVKEEAQVKTETVTSSETQSRGFAAVKEKKLSCETDGWLNSGSGTQAVAQDINIDTSKLPMVE